MELPRYETVLTEMVGAHVLKITLNRPQVGNALNTQMGRDLYDLWSRLTEDAGEVRCAVLTGAGERIFCAGGDLKERNGMTRQQWVRQHELFERMAWTLTDLPLPVIAAVNGHAYGGGFETILSCDFAYASSAARFALTEVTLGIMPGAGGTQNLPRAVGGRRAKEILLTGRPFTVQQAFEWGMVNRVCKPHTLLAEALETAATIAANAPISTRQIKQSVDYGLNMDRASGMMFEIEAYNRMVPTDDRREGIRAFNEKRKPVFQGR